MTNTSFLVAAIGTNSAVLAQCFASSASGACKAVAALFLDDFGEEAAEVACIDTGAPAGLWIPSDPQYMRHQIAGAPRA